MNEALPEVDYVTAPPAVEEDVTTVVSSILASLRVQRAKAGAGADPLYLDVPNYDGQLVLEFKWVHIKELSKTGVQLSKIKDVTDQTIAAAADAVVATCSELMVIVEGVRKPLATDGVPVTFGDPRVAFALGFPPASDARTTAIQAFNNPYALIRVANKVTAWLEDTSLKGDEEFLGE